MSYKIRTARDLRTINRGLVLRLLRDHGPLPRAELARRCGLSATTMTKVVADLIDEGYLAEGDSETPSRVGRPGTAVALVPGGGWAVGVQVGTGTIQLGLCDLHGTIHQGSGFTFDVATDPADAVLDRIATHIRELVSTSGVDKRRVLGIGVAAPGPVDQARRVNLLSINLGWHDVAFGERLESAVGVSTLVDHNVRAMAVAESRFGGGRDVDTLLYVYVCTGVGAGLVIRGEPFRSGPHGVTELGHLRVVEKGRLCACGATGCLETVVSEPYLIEQARAAGIDPGEAVLTALAAATGTSAATIRDELIDHLTTGLASAVNLLNPELILLGGVFDGAPESLLNQIRTSLRAKAFPVLRDAVRVGTASLGRHPGVIGGAAIALDRFLYQPE